MTRTKRTKSRGFVPDLVCSSTSIHALNRPSGHVYVSMYQDMWLNLRFTMIHPEFSLRHPTAKISTRWVDEGNRYLHATSDSRSPDRYGRLRSIRQNSQQTTR